MMRDNALKMNIPKEAILTEEISNNTKENTIASLSVLDHKFGIHTVKNLLVISIPWHYRRAILNLKTYYPKWINYTWCPANYQEHQPDNWWKYPESYEYVIQEIANLIEFVRQGQLIDVEIEI
jgi:uncharacterized SAM-binding protein YcdF (DUF218 family)